MPSRLLINGSWSLCIFDGDCGFCRASVRFAERLDAQCSFRSFQSISEFPPGVTREQCQEEVVFVQHSGEIYGGAAAVAQILRVTRFSWVGSIIDAPVVLPHAERVYAWVARHRSRIPVRGYCTT